MINFLKKNKLTLWQEELFAVLLFIVSLMLLKFFPSQNSIGQTLTGFAFILGLLPFLFIKFILKKDIRNFGWQIVSWKKYQKWIITFFIASLALGFLSILLPLVRENYFINTLVAKYFWAFVFYELVIVNILVFLETAFFQGFILSALKDKLGKMSILAAFLAFMIYLFILQGLDWSLLPFLLIFLATSFLSYLTRSFYWSYGIILMSHILIDAYFIRAIH